MHFVVEVVTESQASSRVEPTTWLSLQEIYRIVAIIRSPFYSCLRIFVVHLQLRGADLQSCMKGCKDRINRICTRCTEMPICYHD